MPEIQPNLNETVFPIEIFSFFTGLEELLEMIVEKSNLYAHQNGRNFTATKEELKAFSGINFDMAINQIATIVVYWKVDQFIGNGGIQNTMFRNHFFKIFQNLHFPENRKDNKIEKVFQIDHLNSKFPEVLSNDSEQSIDEHMVKFKAERSFYTVYFDNFFNSPKLIEKLFQERHLWYWNSLRHQKEYAKNDPR